MRGRVIRFVVWAFDWLRALVLPWLGAPEVLAPTLLVVVIAAGNGEALGLPSLLFPETKAAPDFDVDMSFRAFVAGASVTFLFLEIAFVSFLLERSWFASWVERRRARFFQTNAFTPYAVLAVGVPALLLLRFAFASTSTRASWEWFAGVVVMLLMFAVARATLGRVILKNLRSATDNVRATVNNTTFAPLKSMGAMARLMRPAAMTTNDEVMHALQFVVAALVLLVHVCASLLIVLAKLEFPPMFVLCSLAALVTSVLGALRNYTGRWYVGWSFAALVGAVLFVPTPSWVNEYGALAKGTPRPAYGEGKNTDALINDDDAFIAWRAAAARAPLAEEKLARKECKGELVDAPHLFLVAVSGGGIRAAGWSASVLQSLERDLAATTPSPSFSSHVRIIAGASGGMVGAGAWVGSLTSDGAHADLGGLNPRDAVMSDALPAVARAFAFTPFLDRGEQLERVWTAKSFGLKQKFSDLDDGERAGWRPSLVFTPMSVEDGRRVFVSNLDMSKVTTSSGRLLYPVGERYSLNGVQLFRLFPTTGPDMQLATAARMSASFPYVSAAAELPTMPPVRLVDAGYYDNYGVDVVAHWLLEHERDVKECTAGVAILEIRDESGYGKRNSVALPAGERRKLLVSEVGSPPEAILAAREASMSFRNDELLELLHRVFNGNDERFFTSIVFELHETAPLSWALTEAERDRLKMIDPATPTSIGYAQAAAELRRWVSLDKEPYLDAARAPPPMAD